MKTQVESGSKTSPSSPYQDVHLVSADGSLVLEFVSGSADTRRDPRPVRVLLDTAVAGRLIALLTEYLAAHVSEPAAQPAADVHPINWAEYEGRIPPAQLESLKRFIGGSRPAPDFTLERLIAEEVYYPDDIF